MQQTFEYHEEQNEKMQEKTQEWLDQLPDYIQEFLIGIEGKTSIRTSYLYTQRYLIFFRYLSESLFFNKPMKSITLADLDTLQLKDIERFAHEIRRGSFHTCKKRSNMESTVNNYISALNRFFNYEVSHKEMRYNPCSGFERGRDAAHPVIRLTDEEKPRFYKAALNGKGLTRKQKAYHEKNALRDYAICLTLARTGLRVSELIGLDTKDVDLAHHKLLVLRKRNKIEKVSIDDEVTQILAEYMDYRTTIPPLTGEDALFLVTIGKYRGTRLSVRSVERMVKKYAVAGSSMDGQKVTPHKLRATYACDMLKANHGDLMLVKNLMAHNSVSTTQLYLASAEEEELAEHRNDLIEK